MVEPLSVDFLDHCAAYWVAEAAMIITRRFGDFGGMASVPHFNGDCGPACT